MKDHNDDRLRLENYFDIVEINSEYLRDLIAKSLSIIMLTIREEELSFGQVREGRTFSEESAEVTEDGDVILDTSKLTNYDEDVAMAIVAHELAHYYLEHYKNKPKGLEFEYEADDLAKKWGFNISKFRDICGPPTMDN